VPRRGSGSGRAGSAANSATPRSSNPARRRLPHRGHVNHGRPVTRPAPAISPARSHGCPPAAGGPSRLGRRRTCRSSTTATPPATRTLYPFLSADNVHYVKLHLCYRIPVSHYRCIEVGCRCWRFRAASSGRSVTDRVEQGKPELLGVVLIALHLQHGEPVPLTRTVGADAQQTCLPAAGRSRDDRHPPRRRAIQGSEKIIPVDQPRPALISTPDTPSVGHAVLAPSLSVSGQRTYRQRRAKPRFCSTLITCSRLSGIRRWSPASRSFRSAQAPLSPPTWPRSC
jgi:hypothetical protein